MDTVEDKIEITKKTRENEEKPKEKSEKVKKPLTEAQKRNLEKMREAKKQKHAQKVSFQPMTIEPEQKITQSIQQTPTDYNTFFLSVAGIVSVSGLLYFITQKKTLSHVKQANNVETTQKTQVEDTTRFSTLQLDF
jgi:hypothetical protein